ncbi:hypothetical protein ABW19_dt0209279 [Dactylella cylindrospora]|nr:hypothetical protein ABW19_dt0209279 [Dactylella cylindrospora]
MTGLLYLPNELLLDIFNLFESNRDIASLSQVCKPIREISLLYLGKCLVKLDSASEQPRQFLRTLLGTEYLRPNTKKLQFDWQGFSNYEFEAERLGSPDWTIAQWIKIQDLGRDFSFSQGLQGAVLWQGRVDAVILCILCLLNNLEWLDLGDVPPFRDGRGLTFMWLDYYLEQLLQKELRKRSPNLENIEWPPGLKNLREVERGGSVDGTGFHGKYLGPFFLLPNIRTVKSYGAFGDYGNFFRHLKPKAPQIEIHNCLMSPNPIRDLIELTGKINYFYIDWAPARLGSSDVPLMLPTVIRTALVAHHGASAEWHADRQSLSYRSARPAAIGT